MKITKTLRAVPFLAASILALNTPLAYANQPDSLYLYTYATTQNGGRNGLHAAWSAEGKEWSLLGSSFSFVKSDYGTWGAQKRMLTPFVWKGQDGLFHALWSVNEKDAVLAYATSKDLILWKPQSYITLKSVGTNCLAPEAKWNAKSNQYEVTWLSVAADKDTVTCMSSTSDFHAFTPAKVIPRTSRLESRRSIASLDATASGTITKVPRELVQNLERYVLAKENQSHLYAQNFQSDATLFANLTPLQVALTPSSLSSQTKISPLLMGIFFEDISRAADGGLYAELIQNRDFEYSSKDRREWNAQTAWTLKGTGATFTVSEASPLHVNTPHYAVLTVETPGASLTNVGFEGIALKKGEKYNFSLFTQQLSGKGGKLKIRLVTPEGEVLAATTVSAPSATWNQQKAVLTANADCANAKLELEPQTVGSLALDMISLFPQNTFKGRANGLRADLAQTIADLHPRFMRFPGGCVTHGNGIDNIYRWKNTIGPLQERKGDFNLWGYHQSVGLGFQEYFDFCEDLGCEPLPVLAAGVPCQNSSAGGAGQQGGIPMDQMEAYTQDLIDLIEWANGDAKTTKWGKIRAQGGHAKPYGLKMLGIGNEDLISDVFKERFEYIYTRIHAKYPDLKVVGTAGPFWEGSDYEEGWATATDLKVPLIDEHYYESPSWFLHNQDYYDQYDRSKSHVYLGEWASHGNNVYNALAEAVYLCNLERNADVVEMASYAPLLAKEGQSSWNPDLIYFTNTEVKPTANYFVQMLFGQHSGTKYQPAALSIQDANGKNVSDEAKLRLASSIVRDEKTGDVIVKLVNMLPVAATVDIPVQVLQPGAKSVKSYLFTGPGDSRKSTLSEEKLSVEAAMKIELQPYSLRVLRIK